ncbi:hypothetical protein BGW36DRAFT_397333 [Talaromyces proteolyticus]|uniref:SGNH domain-containing protein n=1 Tax=Talaromyces proteolyticus TaxID=1131652 RepID=A0AAD4KPW6_9EURO|nr:uncharacterized protein BGW36DRAFT_397333 [Talaromyces proteolyticus]KAH8697673.1 hypothetical protein BGW36DRAFT_397333 [Talaromyces proteolyticus]
MRYLTRLNALSGLAFVSLLIAVRLLYVSGNGLPFPGKWGGTTAVIPGGAEHRLVVFGDAWSYTGSRLENEGKSWPEWVCTMWPCRLESYSQKNHACKGPLCGSVVDDAELQNLQSDLNSVREPLPDLRGQIDQWLAAEQAAVGTNPADSDIQARMNSTVFAVSFLVWDVWKFLRMPFDDTKGSTSRSIDVLFEQLDRLPAQSGSNDLKVVLMLSIDPTFLPAFDVSSGQKDLVSVVTNWNQELQEKAKNWQGGSIFVFDTNEFLLDQIRGRQFYIAGMLDGNGLWDQNPWDDVEHPCVETTDTGKWMPFPGNKDERCENPERFLFWDGMHLGPAANQMMGTEIFHGIDSSWNNSTSTESDDEQVQETNNTPINRRRIRRSTSLSPES